MYRARFIVLFILLLFGRSSVGDDVDPQTFRQNVAPALRRSCLECHAGNEPAGKLALDTIQPDSWTGDSLETWRMVYEQVRYGDMPPKNAEQLDSDERKVLLGWIRSELLKRQMPGKVSDEKLLLPQFGNYIDHVALFDERQSRVLSDGRVKLAHVGSYRPNSWGFHDMHGNVAEWCLNLAIRGGSWASVAQNCRSAHRDSFASRNEQNFIG